MWQLNRISTRRPGVVLVVCAYALNAASSWGQSPVHAPGATELAAERTRAGLLAGVSGDQQTRDAALGEALSMAPDYALARWQLGQVLNDDQWLTVEQYEQQQRDDAMLADYRQRRDAANGDPHEELALATWCRHHGMEDAERYYLQRVVMHPATNVADRREAMDRLGVQLHHGMLLTEDQVAQFDAMLAAERAARAEWFPKVQKWRNLLESGSERQRTRVLDTLRELTDPAAISSLELLMSMRSEELALRVVDVLAQIPEHRATQSLLLHAFDAPWATVRDAALERLKGRSLHDYVPLVLSRLNAPLQSKYFISIGPDGFVRHRHQVLREGQNENTIVTNNWVGGAQLSYLGREPLRIDSKEDLPRINKRIAQVDAHRDQQFRNLAYVQRAAIYEALHKARETEQQIAASNVAIERTNERAYDMLESVTGELLPRTAEAWWEWWQEYNEAYRQAKPTYTYHQQHSSVQYLAWSDTHAYCPSSCFAVGTPVRTETGPVRIEQIQPGDRVLSQDPETGELTYKLVLQTNETQLNNLVRVTVDGRSITATRNHLFWVNGQGWRMAKELIEGQQLHGVGSGHPVESVEAAGVAKVYNLVVADFATYFVGEPGVLVHDFTGRQPTTSITPGLHVVR